MAASSWCASRSPRCRARRRCEAAGAAGFAAELYSNDPAPRRLARCLSIATTPSFVVIVAHGAIVGSDRGGDADPIDHHDWRLPRRDRDPAGWPRRATGGIQRETSTPVAGRRAASGLAFAGRVPLAAALVVRISGWMGTRPSNFSAAAAKISLAATRFGGPGRALPVCPGAARSTPRLAHRTIGAEAG
jgi:hypothetical protein